MFIYYIVTILYHPSEHDQPIPLVWIIIFCCVNTATHIMGACLYGARVSPTRGRRTEKEAEYGIQTEGFPGGHFMDRLSIIPSLIMCSVGIFSCLLISAQVYYSPESFDLKVRNSVCYI